MAIACRRGGIGHISRSKVASVIAWRCLDDVQGQTLGSVRCRCELDIAVGGTCVLLS